LTSVTIPDSVTSIGNNAFRNCSGLASAYVNATTPPTLGLSAFDDNAAGRIIYVPASGDDSIINAYQAAANWSSYAASIQEQP
jgi:hypothetical protein